MRRGARFLKLARMAAASLALTAPLALSAVALAASAGPSLGAEDSNQSKAADFARSSDPKIPVAQKASLEQSAESAQLVFDLSAPVDPASFALAAPDRVIVDLPQVDFTMLPEPAKPPKRLRRRRAETPTKLVTSFRFGQLGQGRSRIVVELGAPARIARAICEPGRDGTPARLVVELVRTDRASFRAAVEASRAASARQARTSAAKPPEAAPGQPVVMIDPGHGGIDRGAMVRGLIEKDLVFDFAKALSAKLRAGGRFVTVMTREDDSFVPLSDRVRMARDSHAALFISIHADILSEAADVAGATVYTVSERASDAEAARLAEKENQADAVAGADGADEASGVTDILFDLTRRETRAYSHVFARTLTNYWKVAGRLNKNPQRSAGFRVLKAPDVPSVLLELGYLSNTKDDAALSSAEWREKAAGRVAEAIGAFFAAKGTPAASLPADKDWTPVGKVEPGRMGPDPAQPQGPEVADVKSAGRPNREREE